MNLEIEKLLNSFMHSQQGKFDLNTFISQFGFSKENPVLDFLREYLNSCPAVLKAGGDEYIYRAGFFTNREFSILPTRTEINSGVLIAGHRCMPFCNPEILPSVYSFQYEQKEVKNKIISMQTNDIFEYYSMFGEEFIPQYLAMDKANEAFDFVANDYELPGKMNLTVLDVSSIYKDFDFKSGDRFLVKVNNWERCDFSLSVLKDERDSPFQENEVQAMRQQWFNDVENAFMKVFETYGSCQSIEEQLAYVYVVGEDKLFSRFCGSLEEYIKHTNKICVKEYGVETRLWKSEENMSATELWSTSEVETAPLDEMDELFLSAGVPVSDSLLDSLIFDSLFKKEKSCDEILKRILPEDAQIPMKERLFCLLHLEKRRAIISRGYKWFADYEKGRLRSELLQFYFSMIEFVNSFSSAEVKIEALPQQPLVVLSQLFTHLGRMLDSLNNEAVIEEKDMASMRLSLEGMKFSFSDLKVELNDSVNQLIRGRFTVIRKEKEKNE